MISLDNGLDVLLISDPETPKSAASMDVKAGYFHDPPDLEGLAHFCEHLLFMVCCWSCVYSLKTECRGQKHSQ